MAGLGATAQPMNAKAGATMMSALKGMAAPSNPATPDERKDPTETAFLNQNRIRRSLEKAIDDASETDPIVPIYKAFRAAMQRILTGIDPVMVAQTIVQSLTPPPPPMPGGIMGSPGMPQGMPGQAPTAGPPMPPMGDMGGPVSPPGGSSLGG